jgi:hypothetical protein
MARDAQAFKRASVEVLTATVGLLLLSAPLWADEHWFEVHLTRRYCAVDELSFTLLRAARWVLVGFGVLVLVALVVLRPRLVRLTRTSWRSTAGAALRIGLAVMMAVVTADVVLRVRRKPPPPSPTFHSLPGETFDVDWGGRVINYAMDAHRLRARSPDAKIDLDAPTVLFSGESVVFGIGLRYDETISAQFEARTHLQAANVALGGLATDESLVRMRETLPLFRRPVAVVTFVLYDWLERNRGDERYHWALDGRGQLVEARRAVPAFVWDSPIYQSLRAIAQYHGDGVFEDTRAVLRQIAAESRSRGALPLFVVTQAGPRCVARGGRPWIEGRLMDGLDLPWIAVDFPPTATMDTTHPNAEAAAIYVTAIARALAERGIAGPNEPGKSRAGGQP